MTNLYKQTVSLGKYIFLLTFLIIGAFSSLTYAGPGQPFNNIIFFGDSLSDNGNLYSELAHYMPKSPPYFEGRFSNGKVWSEYAAQYYSRRNHSTSNNFATGGETTVLHNPWNGYLPKSLTESYLSYRTRYAFSDKTNTLFVIWIGSNDYLNGTQKADKTRGQTSTDEDVAELTDEVVDNIKGTIQSLIGLGGMDFLVINLPDFSKIPYGNSSAPDIAGNLHALAVTHNEKLAAAVAELQNSNKAVNLQLFDLSGTFSALIDDPTPFNVKYKINITNTKTACWQGGYRATRQNLAAGADNSRQDEIANDYAAYLASHPKLNAGANAKNQSMNVQGVASFIANTPALMEAYSVEKKAEAGVEPCKNPDSYIFWDHVHPTAIVHQVLAGELIKFINANFQLK